MRRVAINILALLSVIFTMISCERKPLYDSCYCEQSISVPIDINWVVSTVIPQNVTILFYDSASGELVSEHIYEHNSSDVQSYAYLQAGSYTAVVFNEKRDQIDYVSCVGYDNLSTLKFECNDDTPLRARAATRSYIKQPGDLAVAVIRDIEVTEDMILEFSTLAAVRSLSTATKSTIESLTNITPLKKTNSMSITAHVNGLHNALMPALADLTSMADGYWVEADCNSSASATIQFTMNNRTYDTGSTRNGTIEADITTFGLLGDRSSFAAYDAQTRIELCLLFQLVDTITEEAGDDVDITDEIIITEVVEDGTLLYSAYASVPNTLTDVEPAGSAGSSGFGSSVEDWGDIVDVPLFN